MYKICVFGGTSEGKELINRLAGFPELDITCCVATDYGKEALDGVKSNIFTGKLSLVEMINFMKKENFHLIIDATHPYAELVTQNILNSAKEVGCEYLRVLRNTLKENNGLYFNSIDDVVSYLNKSDGNILLTTGSKELNKYTQISNYKERVYTRVLPFGESLDICEKNGYSPKNILAMQGPFTVEMNKAIISMYDIKYLVTKESGNNGGFSQKLIACDEMGINALVIGAPPQVDGLPMVQALNYILDKFNLEQKKTITIVAMGVGDNNYVTPIAINAIKNADIVFGSKRLTDEYAYLNQNRHNAYAPKDIKSVLDNNKNYCKIAILMSGDVGFYSGANSIRDNFRDYEIISLCGVSSPIYLSAKLNMPWQDIKLVSVHGRHTNIINLVNNNHRTFALTGGDMTMNKLIQKLCDYNFNNVKLYVGENLSYPEETITIGTAEQLLNNNFADLSCVIIENENYQPHLQICMEDTAFLREDNIPMTKSEVRAISLLKLKLTPDAIIYDVGAGTGSFSIEAAKVAYQGKVYAIERKEDGCKLIEKNKIKHCTENILTVSGYAPEVLADLEMPTHAFIGGSSGNLKEIINTILDKNPLTKIVVNAITLETVGETITTIKEIGFKNKEIVCVNIAKAKELGSYNLMQGQNPVYIITISN